MLSDFEIFSESFHNEVGWLIFRVYNSRFNDGKTKVSLIKLYAYNSHEVIFIERKKYICQNLLICQLLHTQILIIYKIL